MKITDKPILAKIFRSKDGKVLIKNFGYLSFLELASYFFPLITMPYLARVLGVDIFGTLAIGTAIVAYFQSITSYGFAYTSVRDAARNRREKEVLSEIISVTVYSKAVLMLLSIIILVVCTILIPFFYKNALVIWCTFLIIPGYVLNSEWVFQALEDMKYITIQSIASKLIFTVLVFVVIHNKEDYLWQPILTSIGAFVPAVWGLAILKKKYGIIIKRPSIKSIYYELKNGFSMFITVFLPTVYTQLNTILLGVFNGNVATGIYSGGTKFTSLAYSLFQVISRTVYPFFARKMDQHKFYVQISLAISIIISLFFFIFARPIVMLLLGQEFENTVTVLKIVAFTPIAMSLMNSYGVNFLVLKGEENLMRNIIIFVTLFGVVLGSIGAYFYSYIGVAIASLTTQFIRAFLVMFYAHKKYGYQK